MSASEPRTGDFQELVVRFRLQQVGVGLDGLRRLERERGPWRGWWSERDRVLEDAGLSHKRRQRLRADSDERVAAALERAGRLGFHPTAIEDLPWVRGLPDPPSVLLVAGSVEPGPTVAVVGARACSAYGRRMARTLAEGLAAAGVVVASGLARGIDGEAHRGALAAGGRSLAVLGSGPDRPYPREHADLLRSLVASGTVLTEHLPGVPPLEHHFPRRNRLLVSLADALLVVECRLRSGTFTSVRWAADLGRDVLVVPGPVDGELGEGPLQLLRDGATPVGCAEHILEAAGWAGSGPPASGSASEPLGSRGIEARILALLGSEFLSLDDIVRYVGEPPGQVLAALLGLELAGITERDATMAYGRARSRARERSEAEPPLHESVDRDGDEDPEDRATDEVSQTEAHRLADIVPAGEGGDEVHGQEDRQEEQE